MPVLPEQKYDDRAKLLGKSPAPGYNQTVSILVASALDKADPTLIAVTWAAESSFSFHPVSNYRPEDGGWDVGPLQASTTYYDKSPFTDGLHNPFGTTRSESEPLYDNNGNLTQKTDARGVISIYAYDALNRNTTVDYSDTTGINPDITRVYDTGTNGKGRLRESYAGGNETVGANVEHTKILSYDAVGRPLDQRQRFKTSSVWSGEYQTQRGYNLAGGVTTQTYPSGRTVSYNYDNAGRTSSFSGALGDGTNRTYSTGIIYSSLGGMAKEQFGTDVALYNKSFYNSRGQLSEIRVSSQYTGPTDTTWNRGAIINHYSNQCWGACNGTDNNGNLKKQEVYIPLNDQLPTTSYSNLAQFYDYDSLNRLERVRENSNGGPVLWQQEFVFDRWGNRTIHQTNTWGTGIPKPNFGVNTSTNRLTAPIGFAMTYDNAGNLTADTYTGAGLREYDAENRMTKAWGGNNQWQEYTYNADGQRVRRKVDGVTTWQVYGMDGELLAEYAASGAPASPQKEYGYRNGQLLVTAAPAAGPRVNHALTTNGGYATASSSFSLGHTPNATNNGDRKGLHWGTGPSTGSGWNDATSGTYPDWLQIDFNGSKTIDEINVITLQDDYSNPVEPTESMTFATYGITGFDVQYWNGSGWATITGGSVTGNNKVWRKFTFTAVTTSKIKVQVNTALADYSRVVELEAWGTVGGGGVELNWLVADQLGTPRMVLDKTGNLGSVKRHDYLPFGEELFAGVGGRTTGLGYTADTIRQKFTQYERDNETGLDYANARYCSSSQGRFTSPDPLMASAKATDPQRWNRYSYVVNNPLKFVDPSGMIMGKRKDGEVGDISVWEGTQYTRGTFYGYTEADVAEYEAAQALSKQQGKNPQNSQHERSSNSTMVITWDVDLPWSPVGHVSYIMMQNDMSYSWDMDSGEYTNQEWTKATPSSDYADKRSKSSEGHGYILDFGVELNTKFQNALLHAYDGGLIGQKKSYDPIVDNCGQAFNKGVNAISKEIGVKPIHIVSPWAIRKYIENDLKKYIAATVAYPKH